MKNSEAALQPPSPSHNRHGGPENGATFGPLIWRNIQIYAPCIKKNRYNFLYEFKASLSLQFIIVSESFKICALDINNLCFDSLECFRVLPWPYKTGADGFVLSDPFTLPQTFSYQLHSIVFWFLLNDKFFFEDST